MQRTSVKVSVLIVVVTFVVLAFVLARRPVQAATLEEVKPPCSALEEISSNFQPSDVGRIPCAKRRLKVTGEVYDAVTRQGIAGAIVQYNNCYSHPLWYPTRADGSYEIGWTAYLMCINSFEVSAPGYRTLRQPITYSNLLKSSVRNFYLLPYATVTPTPYEPVTPTPYTPLSTPTPYGTPTPTPYTTSSTPTPNGTPTPTPYVWPTPTPYEWPTPTPYDSLTPPPTF